MLMLMLMLMEELDEEIDEKVASAESFLLPFLGVLVAWQLVVWLEDLLIDSSWIGV